MLKKFIGGALIATFALGILPVFAENSTSTNPNATSTPPASTSTTPVATSPDIRCVQNAIDAHDNALIFAWDAYGVAIKSALQARRDATKSAWSLTDPQARRNAIRTAEKNYKNAERVAKKDFETAKRNAEKKYKSDIKNCGANKTGKLFKESGKKEDKHNEDRRRDHDDD